MTIRDLLGVSPSLRAMPEKKRTARKVVSDLGTEGWAMNRAGQLNGRGVAARIQRRRGETLCIVYKLA